MPAIRRRGGWSVHDRPAAGQRTELGDRMRAEVGSDPDSMATICDVLQQLPEERAAADRRLDAMVGAHRADMDRLLAVAEGRRELAAVHRQRAEQQQERAAQEDRSLMFSLRRIARDLTVTRPQQGIDFHAEPVPEHDAGNGTTTTTTTAAADPADPAVEDDAEPA